MPLRAPWPVLCHPVPAWGTVAQTFKEFVVEDNLKNTNGRKPMTDGKEFAGRSHLLIEQEGWQEVAASALSWAKARAAENLLLP